MAFRRPSMWLVLLATVSGPSFIAATFAAPKPASTGQVQIAMHTSGSRGSVGINFLGLLTAAQAADLGLPNPFGALVDWVRPGSAAEKAGLKVEDFIVEVGGRPIDAPRTLGLMSEEFVEGTEVPFVVIRGGRRVSLTVEIGPPIQPMPLQMPMTEVVAPDRVDAARAPFGMDLREGNAAPGPRRPGPTVRRFVAESIALENRMAGGDVLLRINGKPVSTVDEALAAFKSVQPGETARVVYWREEPAGASEHLALLRRQ